MNSKSREQDLGLRAVEAVYETCMIDREWSLWEERGFSWWPYRLRQRVWAEPGFMDHGFKIYRLCARTDCLRDLEITDEILQKVTRLARQPTVASLLIEPDARRLCTFSSVYVHEENFDWLARGIFGWIAVIQIVEAELIAENLPGEVNAAATPDYSGHPSSGRRLAPDDTLNLMRGVIKPFGERHRRWAECEEYPGLVKMLNEDNCFASARDSGLTAEFPFGSDTTLLQIVGDAEHPRVGSGVSIHLQLPLQYEEAKAARLAMELNLAESRSGRTAFPFLGSWTAFELGEGYSPAFVSFLPSIFYAPGMAFNVTMNQVGRAKWVRDWFGAGESDVKLTVWRRLQQIMPFIESSREDS